MKKIPKPIEGKLVKRIFDRIEHDRLIPRPRWKFILKNYSFWFFGALAVILGALAFAAAIFEIENAGWNFYEVTNPNFISFFFSAIPYLWGIVFLLFIGIGYRNIHRTKRGYRYPLIIIAFGAILLSSLLGVGLSMAGLGGEIEESIGDHPPFYRPVLIEEQNRWLSPQEGLLWGVASSSSIDRDYLTLKDSSGQVWTVNTSDVRGNDLTLIGRGETVRIVGVPVTATSSIFHACFVFPWEQSGGISFHSLLLLTKSFSTSERIASDTRSDACKNIVPYAKLRLLEENGF